jgi:ABC-2 type transport system permease protein
VQTGRGAPRDPRLASSLSGRGGSRHAILPSLPLAPLSVGQSDLLPAALRVSTEAREQVLSAAEIENPHRLLDGKFDLTFVVLFIYPLLILALSYNLLAGEREQGTLSLLLSQPVALGRIVAARIGLRLGILVGITVIAAAAAIVLAGPSRLGAGGLVRVAFWVAAVGVYGAFWFAVAFAVGSLGRGSATTALAVAGIWLAIVAVVPALLNLAINTAYPMPSRVQMVQAMREASDDASARGSAVLARYFEDHPELVPDDAEKAMSDFSVTRVAVADEVERLVQPVVAQYERQIARQRAASARWRFASPALVMRDVLDDVAGTGAARHAAFVGQVDGFHRRWREFFTPLILKRGRVERLEDVPSFPYVEETTGQLAARVAPGIAILAAITAVLAAVGARGVRRYPITE